MLITISVHIRFIFTMNYLFIIEIQTYALRPTVK